jgi:hypothetical protein
MNSLRVVALAVLAELAVIDYRTCNPAVTGFVTSDEANHALRAMDGWSTGIGSPYVPQHRSTTEGAGLNDRNPRKRQLGRSKHLG